MAGANISGDLANPQKSIPKGTLIAIAFTTVVYILLVIFAGATSLRDADGIHFPTLLTGIWNTSIDGLEPVEPKSMFASYFAPSCSSNGTCPYGLVSFVWFGYETLSF
jgi:amino acid transporter